MYTIAVSNRKGGVAKTTTVYELAAALHGHGFSVLSVDFDPQGSLTRLYRTAEYSILPALEAEEAPQITDTQHGGIVAAAPALARAERVFPGKVNQEYKLKNALAKVPAKYDFCIIDTPPAIGFHTMNALTAADALILPVAADTLTFPEAVKMIETARTVRGYSNSRLSVVALLLCGYEARRVITRQAESVYQQIADGRGAYFMKSKIRRSSDFSKAQAARISVREYAPKGNAAADYEAAAIEILELIKRKDAKQ